jgi:hypothetical protein
MGNYSEVIDFKDAIFSSAITLQALSNGALDLFIDGKNEFKGVAPVQSFLIGDFMVTRKTDNTISLSRVLSYFSPDTPSTYLFDLSALTLQSTITIDAQYSLLNAFIQERGLYLVYGLNTKRVLHRINSATLTVTTLNFNGVAYPEISALEVLELDGKINVIYRVAVNDSIVAMRNINHGVGLSQFDSSLNVFLNTSGFTNATLSFGKWGGVQRASAALAVLQGGEWSVSFQSRNMDNPQDISRTISSEVNLFETRTLANYCHIGSTLMMIYKDTITNKVVLRVEILDLGTGWELDLGNRLGLLSAEISCGNDWAVIKGNSSTSGWLVAIDPFAGLQINGRIRASLSIPSASLPSLVVTSTGDKLYFTYLNSNTSTTQFWSIHKKGISRVFIKGNPSVPTADDMVYSVRLISERDAAKVYIVRLQATKKTYTQGTAIVEFQGGWVAKGEEKHLWVGPGSYFIEPRWIFLRPFESFSTSSLPTGVTVPERAQLVGSMPFSQLESDTCGFATNGIRSLSIMNDRVAIMDSSNSYFCIAVYLLTKNQNAPTFSTRRIAKLSRVLSSNSYCSKVFFLAEKSNGSLLIIKTRNSEITSDFFSSAALLQRPLC